MKIHERHGEIIVFEDPDYTTPIYIRGHVTPEQAAEALAKHCAEECDPERDGPCEYHRPAELRYRWARWQPAKEGDAHDSEYTWHTRRNAAPGWAQVTRVETALGVREREEKRATEYWIRSFVARRFPGAQVVDAYGPPKSSQRHAHITFLWHGLKVRLRPFVPGRNATVEPARGYISRVAMWERWHR
jgi:hypothetical protein